VALVGNPNCGKTALFNLLTGSRQKVANYAGVTVERKEGRLRIAAPAARPPLRMLDLPGAYSLQLPRSPDERVSPRRAGAARPRGEKRPDEAWCVCVVDATNLRRNLRLVLAVRGWACRCRRAEHERPGAQAAA
jgi:ferrous iron transport protein B